MGDDWDDDAEFDDDDDVDEEDTDEPTVACPYCRRQIHEDAQRCPYCERYISAEDAPRLKPWWLVLGVIVCLAIILWWIVGSG
jgi:hypothetical protein